MTYIEGDDRDQELLLPESLEGYITEDNPVRFIDLFVDKLNLVECGFVTDRDDTRGRPRYAPGDLLKLYLYGYSNRTRSSRMLERACYINMEVIWLMRRLKPDHKTIAEFRRRHSAGFKKVFRQFVMLSRRLGLVAGELVAIDGTQIKAVNHPKKNMTQTRLKRMINEADKQIEAYLKRLDDEDAREKGGRKLDRTKLRSKLAQVEAELESMKELEASMEAAAIQQLSHTDPESRTMAKNPRIGLGYNAQASADEKHAIVVAEDVTNDVHDYDQLEPMARQSKENLGDPEGLDVTADKGYDKASQMKAVEDMGCRCHVPGRKSKPGGSTLYSKDAFRYLKTKDAYRCPAGKLLPRRYEALVEGKMRYTYCDPRACEGCALMAKCTTKQRGRSIVRRQDEDVVERIRKRMKQEPEKYKRRGATIEKVFGTIKWAMGGESLLMKGLENARGEWSLLCSCYNLKRIIKIMGMKALMEAFSASCLTFKSISIPHNCPGEAIRYFVAQVIVQIIGARKTQQPLTIA